MPRVSVGVPVYNGARFLDAALESLLAQTYTDFDVLILDNASEDTTPDIAEAFAARDDRVTYRRNPENIGMSRNFNKAFTDTDGEYMMWAAADDMWEPTFIAKCVAALDERPDASLSYTLVAMIGADGERLPYDADAGEYVLPNGRHAYGPDPLEIAESPRPEERFASAIGELYWCFAAQGVFRRTALDQTKLHRGYVGDDKMLLADLALVGPFVRVDEELFLRRLHDWSSFSMDDQDQRRYLTARREIVPYQFKLLADYLRLANKSCLDVRQRLVTNWAVLSMLTRREHWRNFAETLRGGV